MQTYQNPSDAPPTGVTYTDGYDGNGNAIYSIDGLNAGTGKTFDAQAQSYTYPSPLTSHRLQSVAGTARSYDANGNTTQIGSALQTYDDRNRLSAASGAAYVYNGKGERVAKTIAGISTIFAYTPAGQLLTEYRSPFSCNNPEFINCDPNFTGLSWPTEYIWLDGTLVGVVQNGNPYYVETDQLGSPRKVIQPDYPSSNDKVVWNWDSLASAFGENAANPDPRNSGNAFVMNVRFPGQYYDAETGLNYNYFRDYDASTGRYVESDPVGLRAGPSTYAYVRNSPLKYIDRKGLEGGGSWSNPTYIPPPPGSDSPGYIGGEGHFFVGGGLTSVTCTDKCGQKKSFKFWKVCFGGAIGFSGGAGLIAGMDGENCNADKYKGWFYEAGASYGVGSAGYDVGYNDDGTLSGATEGSLGGGFGAKIKSTWCYYIPLGN